ncbi:MAG: sensor histidine kinase, partial [Vulcanimicrobiaceae bacterium]
MKRWLTANPMRVFAGLEIAAIGLAFSYDLGLALIMEPYQSVFHPYQTGAALAMALISTAAVLGIKPRPGNNAVALGLAAVALPAYSYLPPYGVLFIVLSLILTLRLTFANGIRGTLVAIGITAIATAAREVSMGGFAGVGVNPHTYVAIGYLFLFSVVVVLFAAMLMYAREATQRERVRIASDLHDALGHGLTTLNAQLENAERLRADRPALADSYVALAKNSAARLLEDVRESVGTLKATSIVIQPLRKKLKLLLRDFELSHSILVVSQFDSDIEPSPAVSHTLYRIAQELLTNVVRHAGATQIHFTLLTTGDILQMTVGDDGSGFSTESAHEGGLSSIRERVAHLGGTFEIVNSEG